ncbi:MAG: GGDEF domain-containing protein [Pseudomonadota bacterium]
MNKEHVDCPNCAAFGAQLAEKDRQIAALTTQLDEMNQRDLLTGVLNRRTLSALLQDELHRSYRTGQPFCFAIIIIDKLDEVRARHGSADALVLKMMADASTKLLRILDRFGRMSEGEFGIILPATWLEQGGIAIKRLKKTLSECAWDSVAPGSEVTFSVGLTTNAPGDTSDIMIRRAEDALAQASAAGPDSVVQLEEPLPSINLSDDD